MFSFQRALRLFEFGCEVFLATLVASANPLVLVLAQILVSYKFANMFPDEVFGLLPVMEVEFAIDSFPGTMPISRVPHRMTPLELTQRAQDLVIGVVGARFH